MDADMVDLHIDIADDLDEKVQQMPEVKATAFSEAERVAQIARDTAPAKSGDYKSGIQVQPTKTGARVYASDHKSAWIEFGVPNRNEPARWILRRAVEAAGLKFTKRKH